MSTAYDFDLLCIGSGPAGQRAAVQAAKLGKRVAVVEKRPCLRHLPRFGYHPEQNVSRSRLCSGGEKRAVRSQSRFPACLRSDAPSLRGGTASTCGRRRSARIAGGGAATVPQ